ncbi:MAG: reverse transcriptase family protein [Bacteroidales bacterium]|nr:reverse transcriptase family protein [Bacteroidales bacterium]
MSIIENAPYVSDWPIIGKHSSDILKLMNRRTRNRQYHQFEIPKKSGGTRKIIAPTGNLKDIQRTLAVLLSFAVAPDTHAHGFIRKRSVITNASIHIGKNYVLNLDLKNFFPSITYHQVERALRKYFCKEVSAFIAKICTWTDSDKSPEDVLPQGAPTSPILSNMACEVLDTRLSELAASYGLTYSRYADDITFSSNHSVYSKESAFWPKLRAVITECGFQINESKTRLLKKGARQEVTGITVEEKLNVSRKWMKQLRAQLFHYEMYGGSDEEYRSIMGKIAFLKMVRGSMDERAYKLYNRARHSHHGIPMME